VTAFNLRQYNLDRCHQHDPQPAEPGGHAQRGERPRAGGHAYLHGDRRGRQAGSNCTKPGPQRYD
jgi:hypothetical protein